MRNLATAYFIFAQLSIPESWRANYPMKLRACADRISLIETATKDRRSSDALETGFFSVMRMRNRALQAWVELR
jgi:hypothetical protein